MVSPLCNSPFEVRIRTFERAHDFEPGTDLLVARQLVQERLALAQSIITTCCSSAVILPPLSSLSRCLKIGLWSDTKSQMEMTTLTKWTIRRD